MNFTHNHWGQIMMLEVRHLRSIVAIVETGSLARAADRLHVTQSALSHQIKGLETALNLPLFLRSAKPLRLTPAGQKLLSFAQQTLPRFADMESDLKRMAGGATGRLFIAIECHACFEWLLPVLEKFRRTWPEVDVDIRLGASFAALPALQRGEVDLVVSSDPAELTEVAFEPLFDYQALLVAAPTHPLADKAFILPEDLAAETLITYPVERSRLDVFSRFLHPAGVEPAAVRQVELTAVILLLVASCRGVAVLPDWVIDETARRADLAIRPLTEHGMGGTLYAAVRQGESVAPFMADFIAFARRRRGDAGAPSQT
ncbi:MAG TPA: LysR family transcriptional regulator [Azospirillaceae bacterium]|nr:LysR family transcriptional regulator [Azospirillaceae bacterium]HRQ80761.1 LysR family transcriptional regulator [Azospirillaceae bacterium]